MELFDSHCHIDVADFDTDREQVLQQCCETGIREILVPAIDRAGWPKLLNLCQQQHGLYPTLGMHPIYINDHQEGDITELEKLLAANPLVVAIGEIGLDFFVKELPQDKQQQLFEAQLAIARDASLPVVLHVRKAHDQVLSTLKRIRVKGGFSHAFNGSLQQAQQYMELGFKLGFGGTMTYEGSKKIHQLAKSLPLEAMVLETDAPDMVVAAHRGERNSPLYLTDCLQALATLRNESTEHVAQQTTRNAREVLGLE